MNSLIPIVVCMFLGGAAGFYLRARARILRAADKVALVAVYCLLFILGANLGAKPELFTRLPELGAVAFVLSVFCSVGSVIALRCMERFFTEYAVSAQQKDNTAQLPSPLWGTARILVCFIAGVMLSKINALPLWLCNEKLAEYALWLLVFMVGVGLGGEVKAFGVLRVMSYKILAVPALIVFGTFVGALAALLVLHDFSAKDTLSVGAGFGYYSLSSIIIGESGNAALASIALLSNIFRELLGIITAPFLARYVGPLSPIAVAGATAMDTCLPVIARFSGESFAIIAVFSGMVLSLLVPFLVAFVLAL